MSKETYKRLAAGLLIAAAVPIVVALITNFYQAVS
jgi:hypothetical protein